MNTEGGVALTTNVVRLLLLLLPLAVVDATEYEQRETAFLRKLLVLRTLLGGVTHRTVDRPGPHI